MMRDMRRSHGLLSLAAVALVALVAVGCWYRGYLAGALPSAAAEAGDVSLPPGFRIAVYAADVPNARQMAAGPPGVVFVGSRSEGKVYAVVDRDGDHRADAGPRARERTQPCRAASPSATARSTSPR